AALSAAAELVVAVPDVADGDGIDLETLAFHFENDVDVLLAAPADAEEGDAGAFVGAVGAVVGRGGQGQGAAGGGGSLQEVTAVLDRKSVVQGRSGRVR